MILAQTDVLGGQVLAERWRMLVDDARFAAPDGRPISVQISVGVASYDPSMSNSDALVARADEALYRAKADGRNRVVVER